MVILNDYVAEHPEDTDAASLLQEVTGDNLMLLGFEPAWTEFVPTFGVHPIVVDHDWKVIVATGNPDTADNTAVYIPGVGSDEGWNETTAKAGTSTYIDYAANINAAAETQDRSADNVTIMWLGYDAPATFADGADQSYAEQGGDALDRFTSGIESNNQVSGSSITHVGHSYGSTVAGYADQVGDTNAAEQVVLVGSPGPGSEVDDAADFNVGEDNVYVMQSDNDVINYADEVAAGPDPTNSNDFPQRVEAGDGDHMSYFTDPDALESLGRIITGQDADPYDVP